MAISSEITNKLIELLKTKQIWTNPELTEALGVDKAYCSKNKKELESMGVQFVRKTHKPHKPHKIHSHKGFIKDLELRNFFLREDFNDLTVERLKKHKSFLLRYLINQLYYKYKLVVPFPLESELIDLKNGLVPVENLLELDVAFYSSTLDVEDFLKSICNGTHPTISVMDFPSNITVFLVNILRSVDWLKPTTIPNFDRKLITKTFVDMMGFKPSEEQIQCVYKALNFASKDSVYPKGARSKGGYPDTISVQSSAGASKTTCALVIQEVVRLVLEIHPMITAKTNKALTGITHSRTLSKLYMDVLDLNPMKDTIETLKTKSVVKGKCIPFLIVDESSMVGEADRQILSNICEKVLYMGDRNQLKPIQSEEAFDFNFLHSLTEQYRFLSEEAEYQRRFSDLFKQRRYVSCTKMLEEKVVGEFTSEIKQVPNKAGGTDAKSFYDESFKSHEELLKTYESNTHQVIAYSQNAVDHINTIINSGSEIKVGSKVMLTLNDYEQEQYNGFQYRVLEVNPTITESTLVDINDDGTTVCEDSYVVRENCCLCEALETGSKYILNTKDLQLAYAMTTYKVQGSEWKDVLVIDGTSTSYDRNKDRYVMITRASRTTKILKKVREDLKGIVLSNLKNAKEGTRNTALYNSTVALSKSSKLTPSVISELTHIALSIGLEEKEIEATIQSAMKKEGVSIESLEASKTNPQGSSETPKATPKKSSKNLPPLESLETIESPKPIQYLSIGENKEILKSIGPRDTLEEAIEGSTNKDDGKGNKILGAINLLGTNLIVIDLDSKETVDKYKDLIETSRSYLSPKGDKAHIYLTTNKQTPRMIGTQKNIDILGNNTNSLVYIKDNKTPNNLEPIELTEEIWNRLIA